MKEKKNWMQKKDQRKPMKQATPQPQQPQQTQNSTVSQATVKPLK
ncbi:MAG: hypothetical protein ABH843_08155 [Candidatus Omnitrophota bacterium]